MNSCMSMSSFLKKKEERLRALPLCCGLRLRRVREDHVAVVADAEVLRLAILAAPHCDAGAVVRLALGVELVCHFGRGSLFLCGFRFGIRCHGLYPLSELPSRAWPFFRQEMAAASYR